MHTISTVVQIYTVEPSEIKIKKNNLSLIYVSDFLTCPTSPKPEILEDRETSTLSLFFRLQFSWKSGTVELGGGGGTMPPTPPNFVKIIRKTNSIKRRYQQICAN